MVNERGAVEPHAPVNHGSPDRSGLEGEIELEGEGIRSAKGRMHQRLPGRAEKMSESPGLHSEAPRLARGRHVPRLPARVIEMPTKEE